MSWLDSIKGALVEEDPKPTATIIASTPIAGAPMPVFIPGNRGYVPTMPSDPGPFLSKLRSKLNTQGGAVDKFETAFKSLSAISDDGLRLSSTLAVLKSTAGIETGSLLQEYSTRRQQLDVEAQSFAGIIAGQRKSEIDDKQTQIAAIDSQLQQLSMQRQSMTSAIDNARNKLDRSQADFDSAVNVVRGEIESALSKLKGLS